MQDEPTSFSDYLAAPLHRKPADADEPANPDNLPPTDVDAGTHISLSNSDQPQHPPDTSIESGAALTPVQQVTDYLAHLAPRDRLDLRTQLPLESGQRIHHLAKTRTECQNLANDIDNINININSDSDRIRVLDLILNRTRALTHGAAGAGDLNRDLDSIRDLASTQDPALDLAFSRAHACVRLVNEDLLSARDILHDLYRTLGRSSDRDLALERGFAHALDRHLDRDLAIARALDLYDFPLIPPAADILYCNIDRIVDLSRTLDHGLDLASTIAHGLARDLSLILDRVTQLDPHT